MVPTRPPGLRPALEPMASNHNRQGAMRHGKSFGRTDKPSQKPSPRWSTLRHPVEEAVPLAAADDPLCYSPMVEGALEDSEMVFQSPVGSEFLETPVQGRPAPRRPADKAVAEQARAEKASAKIALADAEKAKMEMQVAQAKIEMQAAQAKLEMQAAQAKLEMQAAKMDAERAKLDTERAWLELEKAASGQ